MKKQFTLLLFITTLFIAGCGKDKDKKPADGIFGRWYVTEMESGSKWYPVTTTCMNGMYAEFTSDGVYKSYESCDNETYNGTYSKSGKTITCKVGGATVVYKIIELSGNTAVLELHEDGDSMKMKAERR